MYRFLGTSMDSTSGRPLLQSVCKQLEKVYGDDADKVPSDYKQLVTQFAETLKSATAKKPLVVFLDSLDQVSIYKKLQGFFD